MSALETFARAADLGFGAGASFSLVILRTNSLIHSMVVHFWIPKLVHLSFTPSQPSFTHR